MKKYEILYDWAIAEITQLADSAIAEEFADSSGMKSKVYSLSLPRNCGLLALN